MRVTWCVCARWGDCMMHSCVWCDVFSCVRSHVYAWLWFVRAGWWWSLSLCVVQCVHVYDLMCVSGVCGGVSGVTRACVWDYTRMCLPWFVRAGWWRIGMWRIVGVWAQNSRAPQNHSWKGQVHFASERASQGPDHGVPWLILVTWCIHTCATRLTYIDEILGLYKVAKTHRMP